MGFKDRLREKRVEANLTQAALAEKVSVTARTIQNYELGSRKPTKYEVVKKIAEALNTTPEYLLGNSGMLVLAAQEQGGASISPRRRRPLRRARRQDDTACRRHAGPWSARLQ